MAIIEAPFHPIIYIRGFAANQAAIEDTVATPYMGFNLGSTKLRQEWTGDITRHIFESPLIRLMKDFGYRDIYAEGREQEGRISPRSIIIHRYYEQGDRDIGSGDGTPSIEEAAQGLSDLILRIRDQVCGDDPDERAAFRVYLVAHSMGGLIARCLLQNDGVGSEEARKAVDKVFTYGTPHNGIEVGHINVPRFLGVWDISNFSRKRMAQYLKLPDDRRVDTLNGKFPESRFFCLVGTNHRDYNMVRYAVGPMSDGLVLIRNASIQGAPRVFCHLSHSGHFGMVNSEEGYHNLTRFLFGDVFVQGSMQVEHLPLPPSIQKEHDAGRQVRGSYLFDATVMVRGSHFRLSQRSIDTESAVFRSFDEMFPKDGSPQRSPVLFSIFLDSRNIASGRTIVFTVDLLVRSTDFRIDGNLFTRKSIPEENLYRERITVHVTATRDGGWNVTYNNSDEDWGESTRRRVTRDAGRILIPLESAKGFRARLCLDVSAVN